MEFFIQNSRKRYKNSSRYNYKTQTIYLFNQWSDLKGCSTENPIAINIIGIVVDKPNDVNACDSYTLPILTTGKYYTIWREGNQLNPGTQLQVHKKFISMVKKVVDLFVKMKIHLR
jgi:hypothetical protein